MTDADAFAGVGTQELVDRMAAAGEWPEPDLLDAIAARGGDAVEPLLRLFAGTVHDWPEAAPVEHAIMILGAIGDGQAVPTLIAWYRDEEDFEALDMITDALHGIGAPALPALIELMRDTDLTADQRSIAGSAATDIVRFYGEPFDEVAATLRETVGSYIGQDPAELEEEESDLIGLSIINLLDLRDPLARELIDAAFAADLVDEFFVGADEVRETYSDQAEPRPPRPPFDWPARYREQYEHKDDPIMAAPDSFDDEDLLDEDEAAVNPFTSGPPPALAPLLTARLGRNDPCWCGSGKKYKKCHLDADLGRA